MKSPESTELDQKNESSFSIAEMDSQTPSCDLHSLTPDEAISKCDSFINHEFVAGTKVVKIVHGRGTGKLKEKIQAYLKDHELVEDFRNSQNPSEINAITIVILIERH